LATSVDPTEARNARVLEGDVAAREYKGHARQKQAALRAIEPSTPQRMGAFSRNRCVRSKRVLFGVANEREVLPPGEVQTRSEKFGLHSQTAGYQSSRALINSALRSAGGTRGRPGRQDLQYRIGRHLPEHACRREVGLELAPPRTPAGCEGCLRAGTSWVHLLPPFYWVVQGPVIRAADAEEDRLQTDLPSEPARPLVRDRDAILPDPPNGRILVDRVLAEEMRGQGRAVLERRLYEVCRVARERWQKEVASDE
jgi:hypothetical protein